MRLIPRDEGFFPLFDQLALRLRESARILGDLFSDPANRDRYVAEIKVQEHEADEIVQQVRERIDRSFVTPFDREDIMLLASNLDDVLDWMDGAARRAQMFHIAIVHEPARQQCETLMQATELIQVGIANIKKPRVVAEACRAIRQLEKNADEIYRTAIAELFRGAPDPMNVIKWKDLYDVLENAMDKAQGVAIALESISLKHA
ncbi:MAG TPA: DUF47 family protein [Gemmatimonadaceae bacterium]|nr:DUF47 family protein [Gemmatimonadaceae bacterium]